MRLLTKRVDAVSLSVLYLGRELSVRMKLMLPEVLAQSIKTTCFRKNLFSMEVSRNTIDLN